MITLILHYKFLYRNLKYACNYIFTFAINARIHMSTSHVLGSICGGLGAIGATWWLYHNPAELSNGIITGLIILLILILTIILFLESISRSWSGTDWFSKIEFY